MQLVEFSELKHHICSVAHLCHVLLHQVSEDGRAAVENDSLVAWCWEVLLDHLLGDEADALGPVGLCVWLDVDSEVKVEVIRVVLLHQVQLVLEKDVIDSPISEDHLVLSLVAVSES